LVIHIGAQKCASSSLQASLQLVAQRAKGSLDFCYLKPELLRDTNQSLVQNHECAFDYIDAFLSSRSNPQVVVSHEMLGNRPALVGFILLVVLWRSTLLTMLSSQDTPGCSLVCKFPSFLNGDLGGVGSLR
jgi:hypothetical protein